MTICELDIVSARSVIDLEIFFFSTHNDRLVGQLRSSGSVVFNFPKSASFVRVQVFVLLFLGFAFIVGSYHVSHFNFDQYFSRNVEFCVGVSTFVFIVQAANSIFMLVLFTDSYKMQKNFWYCLSWFSSCSLFFWNRHFGEY